MKKPLWSFIVLLLSGLLPAFLPAAPLGGRFMLSLHPGLGFFSMDDLNRALAVRHSVLLPLPTTPSVPSMSWGLDLGTGLQYGICDYLLAGLDLSYLTTDTSVKLGAGAPFPPQDQYYILRVPALELSGVVRAAWPVNHLLVLSAGAGWSFISLTNASEAMESRGTLTGTVYSSQGIPFRGQGWGMKAMAGVEFWVWEWFSLGLEAGYRWAKIESILAKDLQGAEITPQTPGGSDLSIDYSGPFVRYQFNFYF
ncbi:MAG: hypothetical protein AB1439_01925 [candidate division FCPU426 bacterium]